MNLEQELKKLSKTTEGGLPRPEFLARNREFILSYIENTTRSTALPVSSSFGIRFLLTMISQRMVVGTVALGLVVASVSAAASALRALPGERLYGTKLAVEATQARFVSNPAERAKVQMEFAGNRLRELEEVADGQGKQVNSEEALRNFSKDIKRANDTLKQASDPLQVKQAKETLLKKAHEYEKQLTDVKLKPGREVGVAAFEEAEAALKEVQQEESKPTEPLPKTELKKGEVGI